MKILNFLKNFISNPQGVGAIAPSSKYLSEMITNCAELNKANVIVELGPGTGVFTKKIFTKKKKDSIFFAIEVNKEFSEIVKKENPEVSVYCDCGSKIADYLAKYNVEKVDVVISGLPWAAFPESLQDKILDKLYDSLENGGKFLTFAYLQGLILPAGIRFNKKLKSKFSSVKKSSVVWRNLPPAIVYICQK